MNQLGKKKIVILGMANFLLLLFMVLIFRPCYETNDDTALVKIVSGAFGKPDAHMVFTNYFVGIILSNLYTWIPGLPWYALLHYTLMFVAFWGLCIVIEKRASNVITKVFLWILLLGGAFEVYIAPNFTRTASVLGIAGVMIAIDAFRDEKVNRKMLCLGSFLAIWSFLIRSEQFFAVAAVAFATLIPVIYSFIQGRKVADIKKRVTQGVICVCILAVICGLFTVIDKQAYASAEWQEYTKYNRLRSQLLDFGWPDFDENRELYESLEIDEQSLQLYKQWDFYDTERLTTEDMQRLVDAKSSNLRSFDKLYQSTNEFIGCLSTCEVFYFCIVFITILGIVSDGKRKVILSCSYLAVVLFGLFSYLIIIGRAELTRVNSGILLSAAFVLLYLLCDEKIKTSKTTNCLYCGALLCVCLFNNGKGIVHQLTQDYNDKLNVQHELTLLAEDQERVYLVDVFSSHKFDGYNVFDVIPKGISENNLSLGGWLTNCPVRNQTLEKYEITNPFRTLSEDENALLIDGKNAELIITYIQKYYNPNAQLQKIDDVCGCNIYRISHGNE